MDEDKKYTVRMPVLLTLASFIIVVAGMKVASSIVVPFFLAVFIAVICTPLIFWLEDKGIPKVLALVIILVTILAIGLSLEALVGTSLNKFLHSLPQYQERLSANIAPLVNWLAEQGIKLPEEGIGSAVRPESMMQLAGDLISPLSNVLANAFLILLTVIFILLEAADFPKKLRAALKKPEESLSTIEKFSRSANRYVVIKTLISAAVGLTVWLWLLIVGVDYPILWGTLAFALNYVPNIGSILAARWYARRSLG